MKIDVGDGLIVEITLNRTGNPPGKLADAVLYFTTGPLSGLCILGCGVWERREKPGELNATMPSRPFTSNGQRRSFNLIRVDHDHDPQKEDARSYYAPLDRLRQQIIRAYNTAVSGSERDDPVQDDDLGEENVGF